MAPGIAIQIAPGIRRKSRASFYDGAIRQDANGVIVEFWVAGVLSGVHDLPAIFPLCPKVVPGMFIRTIVMTGVIRSLSCLALTWPDPASVTGTRPTVPMPRWTILIVLDLISIKANVQQRVAHRCEAGSTRYGHEFSEPGSTR